MGRILTVVTTVPLLIVLTTTPAHALLGSILAGIQRAQMIANQGLQIYEQKIAKLTMDGQLTNLADQFTHLQDQALGSVGALTQPFTDLASAPTTLDRCWLCHGRTSLPAWRRSLRARSNRWARTARAFVNPGPIG